MVMVADRVLDDPLAYRESVLAGRFEDFQLGPDHCFRGIQPAPPDTQFVQWITENHPNLTPTRSFFRQSPAWQREPNYIHTDRDMGDWTAILYLNPEPAAGDGTLFWRHRHTGAVVSEAVDAEALAAERAAWRDRGQWDVIGEVPAKFGRAVLFPAARFHSRAILENYGTGADARLVQVVFGLGAL